MLTSSLANRVQGKGFVREWRSNGIRFYRGSYRGFIIRFWHVRAFTPVRATIGLASGFLFLRREQNEETESTTIPRPDRTSPPLSTLLGCITSSSRVPCHFYRERRVYLSEEMPLLLCMYARVCVCVCVHARMCMDTNARAQRTALCLQASPELFLSRCPLFTVYGKSDLCPLIDV